MRQCVVAPAKFDEQQGDQAIACLGDGMIGPKRRARFRSVGDGARDRQCLVGAAELVEKPSDKKPPLQRLPVLGPPSVGLASEPTATARAIGSASSMLPANWRSEEQAHRCLAQTGRGRRSGVAAAEIVAADERSEPTGAIPRRPGRARRPLMLIAGAAAPSMAKGFSEDLGIVRACAGAMQACATSRLGMSTTPNLCRPRRGGCSQTLSASDGRSCLPICCGTI
jgi:hypothetical protein